MEHNKKAPVLDRAPEIAAHTADPVVEANRALLLQRSQVGIKKYGAVLPGALSRRELIQHALEEALDLANYLQADLQLPEAANTADQLAGGSVEAEREARAGKNLMEHARILGWEDDGEGAYEYVQRLAYEAGSRAALAKPVAAGELPKVLDKMEVIAQVVEGERLPNTAHALRSLIEQARQQCADIRPVAAGELPKADTPELRKLVEAIVQAATGGSVPATQKAWAALIAHLGALAQQCADSRPAGEPTISVSVDYPHCRHVAPITRVTRNGDRIEVLVDGLPEFAKDSRPAGGVTALDVLKEAAEFARLYDLGTPDGHAIADFIKGQAATLAASAPYTATDYMRAAIDHIDAGRLPRAKRCISEALRLAASVAPAAPDEKGEAPKWYEAVPLPPRFERWGNREQFVISDVQAYAVVHGQNVAAFFQSQASAAQPGAPVAAAVPEVMPPAVEEAIMAELYKGTLTRGEGPARLYAAVRTALAAAPTKSEA